MKYFEGNVVIESSNLRLDIKDGKVIIYALFNDRSISLREDIYKIVEDIVVGVDFNTGEKYYRPGVRLVDLPNVKKTPEYLERKIMALQLLNNHLMEVYLKDKTQWINKNVNEILKTKEPTEEPTMPQRAVPMQMGVK